MNVSRRAVFIGTVAGAGLIVAGGGALALYRSDDLIRSVLTRSVGPFEMAAAEYAAFKAHFLETRNIDQAQAAGYLGAEMFGVLRTVANDAPAVVGSKFDTFERMLVTYFLTRTTFLQNTKPTDPVTFLGPQSCFNPFARFDFD
ncbi:hypothetical protein [Sphingomonas sp. 37zxx]|uniref:hypothetical protein n=1 Tax=Sphingomonas sp. 37zxx TaxID=1550073 RepID=UPI00053BFCEE|nr:hypothetical protein [Sphingomonas sp. 37zxx]